MQNLRSLLFNTNEMETYSFNYLKNNGIRRKIRPYLLYKQTHMLLFRELCLWYDNLNYQTQNKSIILIS